MKTRKYIITSNLGLEVKPVRVYPLGPRSSSEGMEANQDCTVLWYQKLILGFEMTKFSKWQHSNSNHRSLLGSVVIRNFPEEEAIFIRKCHLGKDWNDYGWTELDTNDGEIGPRGRPYQPEAFEPSGPGFLSVFLSEYGGVPEFLGRLRNRGHRLIARWGEEILLETSGNQKTWSSISGWEQWQWQRTLESHQKWKP